MSGSSLFCVPGFWLSLALSISISSLSLSLHTLGLDRVRGFRRFLRFRDRLNLAIKCEPPNQSKYLYGSRYELKYLHQTQRSNHQFLWTLERIIGAE